MLLSLIGLFIVLIVFVLFVMVTENSFWTGVWPKLRLPWWGMTSTEKEELLSTLRSVESERNEALQNGYVKLKNYQDLHEIAYGCAGLESQVKDLKQVLEWTRNHLNMAKQECLEQMGWAHEARERFKVSEDVRRDQNRSLRKRATLIRELQEHITERDGVIANLRVLLEASRKPAAKRKRK